MAKSQTFTQEEFIKRANKIHNNKFDYSEAEYIGMHIKVNIKCEYGHIFPQTPDNHIHGQQGCPMCAFDVRDTESFIQKAIKLHGDRYEYNKVEYINYATTVIIICKIHGQFSQQPNGHLSGHGCPYCINKTEGKLDNNLITIYPNLKGQFKPKWCKNETTNKFLPYDFVLENENIIIELDGPQHFRQIANWDCPEKTQQNDIYKMNCANNNGYSVIRILQEDIWNDKYDWLNVLILTIQDIIDRGDNYISNVFLYENDEYDEFIKIFNTDNSFIEI
jgi:hypothetical protein